ncbi:MAG: hypothetical protein EOO43_16930 [Flavobacterium sp.]|nr:MAG: hypothetical protein EOO43_16930 [Flavobacterium sp.]
MKSLIKPKSSFFTIKVPFRVSRHFLILLIDKNLDYQIILSEEDLQKHLKKLELDQRLRQLDLFNGEYVVPLLKLQMQGLFYYEFDYADICPDTLCILCGLPSTVTDAQLISLITQGGLPGNFFILLSRPSILIKNR